MNTETNQRCGDGDDINHHCPHVVTNGFKSEAYPDLSTLTAASATPIVHIPSCSVTPEFYPTAEAKIIKDAVPITGRFGIEDPRESTTERQREPPALPWWKRHYKVAIVSCIFLLAVFGLIVSLVMSLRANKSSSASNTTRGSRMPPTSSSDTETTSSRVHKCNVIPEAREQPGPCKYRTNSIWGNEDFLCRTKMGEVKRPCRLLGTEKLHMPLSNGFDLQMEMGGTSGDEGTPTLVGHRTSVWAVRTDRNGNRKVLPWNSEYHFYTEGGWVEGAKFDTPGQDWNDYRFGSLNCNLDYWDDDDFVFIIVDGVLLDSCPPYLAEECRTCTA